MGSLCYGEQAGERMRLGLMLHDPEEEHDCFSDNTHNSHYYDGMGIRNVYLGRYVRADGSVVEGPSVSELVAEADPEVDADLRAALDRSLIALGAIKTAAEAGTAYDQMLATGNAAGEALVMGGDRRAGRADPRRSSARSRRWRSRRSPSRGRTASTTRRRCSSRRCGSRCALLAAGGGAGRRLAACRAPPRRRRGSRR